MLRSQRRCYRTPSSLRKAAARVTLEPVEARRLFAVNFQFDYSLDTTGFFTDPARRAILQQAANEVTAGIMDEFTAIEPGGTDTSVTNFADPSTGMPTSVTNLAVPADTIIVYVGAYDLNADVAAIGEFATFIGNGSQAFRDNLRARGNTGALRARPTDFAPYAGSLAFDSSADFYFGADTSGLGIAQDDFLSVAEHELTRILGITGAPSFQRSVQNNQFFGTKSVSVFGAPVPLETDGTDFAIGTTAGGEEALRTPTIAQGTRKTITALDRAALDDLGFDFDPPALPVVTVTATDATAAEPSSDGKLRLTRTGSLTAPLTVTISTSGTAFRGSDYNLNLNLTFPDRQVRFDSPTVTFEAGERVIDLTLAVRNDNNVEPLETATITVVPTSAYTAGGSPASITISDEDLTTIQAGRAAPTAIDVSTSGRTSDLGASNLKFSADGRFATFISNSTDIVTAPLTTFFQVYRRDFIDGTTRLVSIASGDETEANADALDADISADGRYVAFESEANDILKRGTDKNGVPDVYLKDLDTNATTLISRNAAGAVGGELVAISNDGDQVMFRSETVGSSFVKGLVDQNGGDDLFVWSRRTGKYTCVSISANNSNRTANRPTLFTTKGGDASFSRDGRYVVFPSAASDLVAGVSDANTFKLDVFVRDLSTKTTEAISVIENANRTGDAASGNAEITDDGRYVVFRSAATDLLNGVTDENKTQDIFVRDRVNHTTRLLTAQTGGGATANGGAGVPDITADGRFVVFTSNATNLIASDADAGSDAYLYDLNTLGLELLTVNSAGTGGGDGDTVEAHISDDGTRVLFATYADNLPGDFDKQDTTFLAVYARDLDFDRNAVLSFDRGANPSGADSSDIVISDDGTRAGFSSDSTSLVRVDNNARSDLFISIIPGRESASINTDGKLTVRGSPLDDTISVQRVNSNLIVIRNDDRFTFRASSVKSIDVLTGDGDDSVVLGLNVMGSYVSAGSGDDSVRGTGGDDRIQGGPGRDSIMAGNGDDRVDGGKGNDTIFGERDDDNLFGGDGDDKIYGGSGRDRLTGDIGADSLDAGSGNDRFYANDSFIDMLLGGAGNDTAVRKDGDDILNSVEV